MFKKITSSNVYISVEYWNVNQLKFPYKSEVYCIYLNYLSKKEGLLLQ